MKTKAIIILAIIILFPAFSLGQDWNNNPTGKHEWENIIGSLMEQEDDETAEDWETTYDILQELEQNPVDINSATKEELERIPFLNESEISDILEYIYRNGQILSAAELAMIRSLSAAKRNLLEYFICINEKKEGGFPKIKNIIKYGKSTLIATGGMPLYDRKGDKNGYLGYKYKHSLRYDYTYGKYLRIGFVGAQDSGEPFFADRNSAGYDFYSYYATIKGLGRIKNLTVGKYRIRMGMGLIMNNDAAFGKSMFLSSVGRYGTNIRPHSSRSSYNYMQGLATTVAINSKLSLTAFASYKDFDATINKKDGSITSIIKSGYHRTPQEMSKKNNSSESAYGGNIEFSHNGFHGGISGYYASLSRPLKPNISQPYRKYYANGDKFYNVSVDYGYSSGKFSLLGETATGNCNAIATVNMLIYKLKYNFQITAIQRFYSYKYYSLLSQGFSEGGSVQNESGVYVGINWQPAKGLAVTYYSDIVYFPWAKYQASTASHAFDNMLSLSYRYNNWTFLVKYRLKMKEKDNSNKSALIYQTGQTARFVTAYSATEWNVKAQIDITSSNYKESSLGYMASLSSEYKAIKKLRLFTGFAYFNTKDYNSRIYCYERGMLYDFSFPSYFGEGIRYFLLTDYKFSNRLSATAKASVTNYFNRKPIGSGMQQVDKSSLCDINMQIKWSF